MKLLMLTSTLPYPPTSGGALRAYGILSVLHQAGHEVTLLSFHESDKPIPQQLTQLCVQVITMPPPSRTLAARLAHLLFSGEADIVQRMASMEMHTKLAELMRESHFDVVQFEGIEMATYLPTAYRSGARSRLIYDTFNAEYALQEQFSQADDADTTLRQRLAALYSRIQAARIKALEHQLCQIADGVIAVSPEDVLLLRPLRGERPLPIIPSGIFVNDYSETKPLDLGERALVFTGKMDYRPNIDAALWFANSIFPRVNVTTPDAYLYIVGQQPTSEVQALSDRPQIRVTGAVPHIMPYLKGATVYVAPLRMGSGTRLKLLEAMASGCAIVATSAAAAGLDEAARSACMIRDDAEGFAEAITMLLADPGKREAMGEQARSVVRSRYDWSAIAPRLLEVYKDFGLG